MDGWRLADVRPRVAFLSALGRCAWGLRICECVWDSKREGASGVGIMAAIEDVNQH